MVTEFYTTIIGGIGTFLGAFGGWFFRRRSETADAKSKEIDNEFKISDYYKNLLDDLGVRYEEKFKSMVELYSSREKILMETIELFTKTNEMLKQENTELKARISSIK